MDLIEYKKFIGGHYKRHPWEIVRLKILKNLINNTKNKSTILDLGSGDAFLASQVAKKFTGSYVHAIDINYTEELIRELKANGGSNIEFHNDINELLEKENIDIIILMDVLEHIQFPQKTIEQLLSLPGCHKNTRFIITVPAYQSLFSQHDVLLGHYRRYNLTQIKKLVTDSSLKPIYAGFFFNTLSIIRLLQKMVPQKGKTQFKSVNNWNGSSLITNTLTLLFWVEFKITWYLARIGIKIPGLTCYCICQPSL